MKQIATREFAIWTGLTDDGREVDVYLWTFFRARITIGPPGQGWVDDSW